jgi:hypothetical protein
MKNITTKQTPSDVQIGDTIKAWYGKLDVESITIHTQKNGKLIYRFSGVGHIPNRLTGKDYSHPNGVSIRATSKINWVR